MHCEREGGVRDAARRAPGLERIGDENLRALIPLVHGAGKLT
jgi:hypothetical protein